MDRSSESERLRKLYSGMSDSELEKVWAESDELTDDARQILQAEIARRNLYIEVSDPQPQTFTEPELQKWEMVRRFRDLPAAILAKGSLDSAGIDCHLVDENMVRLDWFISNMLGGTKLMVKPEDFDAAEEILSQPVPEQFDYGDDSQFEQPKCPRCGSLDITHETLNKPIAYGSAWLGVPIPLKSEKWVCQACDARWVEEEEVNSQSEP